MGRERDRGVPLRSAGADAGPGAVRDPVFPSAVDSGVDSRPQTRTHRTGSERAAGSTGLRRLPERRLLGEHLDGAGLGSHHRYMEIHRAAGLRGDLCLPGSLASARDAVVHLGDRDRRCRRAVLLVSPLRAPDSADLGHSSGTPLQSVLQLRHRTAPEMEQQRRDSDVDSRCRSWEFRRGWCSSVSRSI